MANQVFIDDEDLYSRLGGKAVFTQLLDPQKKGTWNTGTSLRARIDACNIVLEAAGVQSDLGGIPANEFATKFPNLVTWAALKAIALSWLYGGGGTAMPDAIRDFGSQADAAIEKLAQRRRKNGASDYSPTPSQEVSGSIALSSDRVTLDSYQSGGYF